MLLGDQATTERQAKLISRRIADLLERVQEDEARINATSVLRGLAESYPAQVQDLIPDVANLIEGQHPSTQENAIEFLELTNAAEYRGQISDIHSNTNDEDVRMAADSALNTLNEGETDDGQEDTESDIVGFDSILDEIENEFSQL